LIKNVPTGNEGYWLAFGWVIVGEWEAPGGSTYYRMRSPYDWDEEEEEEYDLEADFCAPSRW